MPTEETRDTKKKKHEYQMDAALKKLEIMLVDVQMLGARAVIIEAQLRDFLQIAKNWRFVARELNGFANIPDAEEQEE